MALINCPECQNQISDKAKACPHCGYQIMENKHNHCTECNEILQTSKNASTLCPNCEYEKMVDNDFIWQYCMDCGETIHRKRKEKLLPCKFCGGSSIRYPSVSSENIDKKTPEELSKWKNDIKAYVMNENKSSSISQIITPSEVRCPKCNSAQIQAVPKKWSLLTGFLTNKVDRVCLNCKNKF